MYRISQMGVLNNRNGEQTKKDITRKILKYNVAVPVGCG